MNYRMEAFGSIPETLSQPEKLAGPIAVIGDLSKLWNQGFYIFLAVLLYISIFLACINLFPIPALDGWGVVMVLAEAAYGRPLSDDWQRVVARSSLSLMLCLSIAVLGKDIWDLI